VPLTALLPQDGGSAVWVVENNVAKLVPVQIGAPVGNDILLVGGVASGQTVVTAGGNSLKPGQKVSILGDDTGVTKSAAADAAGSGAHAASGDMASVIRSADAGAALGGIAK